MFSSINNPVYRNFVIRIAFVLLASIAASLIFVGNNVAAAAESRTFIISAYYSPLPGQLKYATGSYAGDIRLNGNGTNGADGTPVYPGMIAAPKSYPFGTKMHIPGIGTVAVHDRGGAIVSSGQRGNAYDRLDVWMGHGDEGLQRALNWGKRTVTATVYGVDDSIQEHVELEGYTPPSVVAAPDWIDPSVGGPDEESLYVNYGSVSDVNLSVEESTTPSAPAANVENVVSASPATTAPIFNQNLNLGDSGDDVRRLQNILADLGYYNGGTHGTFDRATYDAVASFQISEKIIQHSSQYGSGYVGPRTMAQLASKSVYAETESQAETVALSSIFDTTLKKGDSGEKVRSLQEELRKVHFLGIEPTGHYDEVTEHAVFKFQQSQKLVSDKQSLGAGVFGPITRSKLSGIVAARLESDRLKAQKADRL